MPSAKLQSVEALRLRHVQRPEHESIECAEDHGVCANRHGKRHDGNSGKTGRLVQHAEGETKVLPEIIPKEPAAGLVKALLSLCHVAESAARGGSRLSLAYALFPQAVRLQLDMSLHFGAKVTRLALPSEHGLPP